MARDKVIQISIPDTDTIHTLDYLLTLAKDDKIAGMVFGIAMKHERKYPHLCGATGRLARNRSDAVAISNMLSLKLTQELLHNSENGT